MSRPLPITTDANENRCKWGIIAALLLVISLPYLWALAITPEGLEYQGLLYNTDDQNVHLAWARQAAQGNFFFRDLFTTESLANNERPLFNNLFCWAMGVLTLGERIPLIWIYHALRLLFATLAMLWFHALSTQLTDDRRIRILALFLAAFSMGGGWLRNLAPGVLGNTRLVDRPDLPNFPMMPEAFTFSSAFIFPLYIASVALLALVYLLVLRAQQTAQRKYALGAAVAALLLTNIHTYDAIPLNITLLLWASYSLWQQKKSDRSTPMAWLAPLAAILGTLPPLLYQVIVFRNSIEFQLKAQTPTPPPGIVEMLLSFAPLVLLAIPGVLQSWRQPRTRLMLLWIVVTFAVIYAPVSFGRKMIEGVHLPLCFLAASGIVVLAARVPAGLIRRVAVAAMAVLCCLSTVQFINWCVQDAHAIEARVGKLMPPLYLRSGDAGALRHLARPEYSDRRAVLSLNLLGNYVPGATGKFVYAGHWAETLNFQEKKLPQVLRFFSATMPPSEAVRWLHDNQIGYVIDGHYEKSFYEEMRIKGRAGPTPLPRQLNWTPIYNENGTAIYRVPPERNPNE